MQRPQRNLLIILSTIAAIWILVRLLPGVVVLGCGVVALLSGLLLMVLGRDYLLGRLSTRRREWRKALERYQRFEHKLLLSRFGVLSIPLYLGIYSFDGVAITRNYMGQSLMELGELDEAVRWLRSALRRDPLYAVPYLNLGTIAAARGDEATAQFEFRRAVELGYSRIGAQALLRRALARANEPAGSE